MIHNWHIWWAWRPVVYKENGKYHFCWFHWIFRKFNCNNMTWVYTHTSVEN